MSDLISREALYVAVQEKFGAVGRGMRKIISDAPSVRGDVVGYLCESQDKVVRSLVHKPINLPNHTNIPLYTTPQQHQEQGELVKKAVADALEEVAKLCDELAEQDYCVDVRVASEAIRALIKRNVVKEGE